MTVRTIAFSPQCHIKSIQLNLSLDSFYSERLSRARHQNKPRTVNFVFSRAAVRHFLIMMHLFRVNSFKSANSADPDEIPHYGARHPGPHCLPRFLLASIHSKTFLNYDASFSCKFV